MTKGQNNKKKPAKTLKEKRQAKKEKKGEKGKPWSFHSIIVKPLFSGDSTDLRA
jgi:hypothetical protein